MSLCCDQRIITSNGSIGLNEVALGIPVPTVWGQVMGHVIGTYAAERMCVYAKMVKAEEAKRLGLVDQVIPSTSDSDLTAAAEEAIQAILKLPDASRALVKNDFRSRLGDILGDPKRIAQETENFWAVMNSPEVVKSLELVLARLSAKK